MEIARAVMEKVASLVVALEGKSVSANCDTETTDPRKVSEGDIQNTLGM